LLRRRLLCRSGRRLASVIGISVLLALASVHRILRWPVGLGGFGIAELVVVHRRVVFVRMCFFGHFGLSIQPVEIRSPPGAALRLAVALLGVAYIAHGPVAGRLHCGSRLLGGTRIDAGVDIVLGAQFLFAEHAFVDRIVLGRAAGMLLDISRGAARNFGIRRSAVDFLADIAPTCG